MGEAIAALKALLEELGDGFQDTVQAECEAFSCCMRCGAVDWEGHRPGCTLDIARRLAIAVIAKAEGGRPETTEYK